MKKYALLVLLIILVSCSSNIKETPITTEKNLPTIEEMEYQPPEKVVNAKLPQGEIVYLPDKLIAEDNTKISYTFNKVSDKAVILLHMLNKNKESWDDFASKLQQNGISTIAIDLRGHGKSDVNWQDFSEQDFKNIVLDVKAAKKFLDKNDFAEFYIIGASIGANTALRYAASDPSITKLVLLSPSENYRGITTFDVINDYKGELMIISAIDDTQSYDNSLQLDNQFLGQKKFIYSKTNMHGTDLLVYEDLNNEIINFLKQ